MSTSAAGAGEGLPRLPLPGRLHEGGSGAQTGPDGEQSAGELCLSQLGLPDVPGFPGRSRFSVLCAG